MLSIRSLILKLMELHSFGKVVVELSYQFVALEILGVLVHQKIREDPWRRVEEGHIILLPRAEVHGLSGFLADSHRMDHLGDVLPGVADLLLEVLVVCWTIKRSFIQTGLMSLRCGRTEPNLEYGLKSFSRLWSIICRSFQIEDFFVGRFLLQLLISILGLQLLSLLLLIDFKFSQGI